MTLPSGGRLMESVCVASGVVHFELRGAAGVFDALVVEVGSRGV